MSKPESLFCVLYDIQGPIVRYKHHNIILLLKDTYMVHISDIQTVTLIVLSSKSCC